MAHEKSITRKLPNGQWANFASVGSKKLLGRKTFPTMREAVAAAKRRSASFDPSKKRKKRPARPSP